MKSSKKYLKGQSVFIISILVVLIIILIVYINGVHHARSISGNFYISLSIIGTTLFLFMTYGLYKGIDLEDNFPKFKSFELGHYIDNSGSVPDIPIIEDTDDIGGLIVSILVWIGMTILTFLLLILLELAFWFSIFIILMMQYWVFFRALKLVFSKASNTQGNICISAVCALGYTTLYLGWIFVIVFLSQKF